MRSPEEIICWCCHVRVRDVERAVEEGACTLEQVCGATKAGTACTKCKNTVARVLRDTLEKQA